MKKIDNYSLIKREGYAFYNMTNGLDEELRNQLLENNLARFNSDDEAKVFINTVLYPFDTTLYFQLINYTGSTYQELSKELGIDEKLIIEKFHEYSVNQFDTFLSEFGIKINNSSVKGAKK